MDLSHLDRALAVSTLRALLVFFSLGALLFFLERTLEEEPPVRIVVSPDATEAEIWEAKREAVLVREAKRIGVMPQDPALVQWITEALPEDRQTREDILALLEMDLEERDPVIRRRLVYWGERLLEGQADERVTKEQLAAHLAAHPERFVRPARSRLELVFFSRARRKEAAERDALDVALPESLDVVGEAYRRGDPHMHLRPILVLEDAEVARRFGPEVAEVVREAPLGRWSGPVETRAGVFRVRVLERTPERTPSLDEIEKSVRADLLRERRAEALRTGVVELIRKTEFEVVRR